jgi:hypothetical protein
MKTEYSIKVQQKLLETPQTIMGKLDRLKKTEHSYDSYLTL